MLSAVIPYESSYPAVPLIGTTGTPGIHSFRSSRHVLFCYQKHRLYLHHNLYFQHKFQVLAVLFFAVTKNRHPALKQGSSRYGDKTMIYQILVFDISCVVPSLGIVLYSPRTVAFYKNKGFHRFEQVFHSRLSVEMQQLLLGTNLLKYLTLTADRGQPVSRM